MEEIITPAFDISGDYFNERSCDYVPAQSDSTTLIFITRFCNPHVFIYS